MQDNEVPAQAHPRVSWLPPLQILTNVAVVAGILVLIFELYQTKDLAHVQTIDNAYVSAMSRNLALLGEAPEKALAKAIFAPNSIGTEDVVVLNQYYIALSVSWRRLKDTRAVGYFGGGWEYVVAEEALSLNTEFGRRWWAAYQTYGDPEIIAVVDEILDRTEVADSLGYYQSLLPESDP